MHLYYFTNKSKVTYIKCVFCWCVCVCVCERERERERVCVCVSAFTFDDQFTIYILQFFTIAYTLKLKITHN